MRRKKGKLPMKSTIGAPADIVDAGEGGKKKVKKDRYEVLLKSLKRRNSSREDRRS